MGRKQQEPDAQDFVDLWAWAEPRFRTRAELGRQLGYGENHPGQTVNNWKKRGVPPAAILAAQRLGYQSKATAKPQSETAERLQERLAGMPDDVREAFERAMVAVIDALRQRPSQSHQTLAEAKAVMDEAKVRLAAKSARPTRKHRSAQKTQVE